MLCPGNNIFVRFFYCYELPKMALARKKINQHLLTSSESKVESVESNVQLMPGIAPQISLLYSHSFLFLLFSLNLEAGEKVQQLRALADLGENLSCVPSTHLGLVTSHCLWPCIRGPDALFCSAKVPAFMCIDPQQI